jgi:hypothetical protein
LGKFVEPGLAKERTEPSNAVIVVAGIDVTFGRIAHRAKLSDRKDASSEADALLPEDYLSAALEKDGRRDENEQRKQQNESGARDADIDKALDLPGAGAAGEAEAFLEDPFRRHAVEIDAPPMSLKECLDGENRNLVEVNINQLLREWCREFGRVSRKDDGVVAGTREGNPAPPARIDRRRAWSIQEERTIGLHTGIDEADCVGIAHAAE